MIISDACQSARSYDTSKRTIFPDPFGSRNCWLANQEKANYFQGEGSRDGTEECSPHCLGRKVVGNFFEGEQNAANG